MAKNVKEKIKSKLDQGIKKISEISQVGQEANSVMNTENKKLNIFAIATVWITMVLGELLFLISQIVQQRSFDDFKMEPGIPIYLQIVLFIKRGIVAGIIKRGDELPSRRILSALLGVLVAGVVMTLISYGAVAAFGALF